jgi:hypothetical protein
MFQVNSRMAFEGIKKLKSEYPFLHSPISFCNSPSNHMSLCAKDVGFSEIVSNEDMNLATFHNLDKKFFATDIFCSENYTNKVSYLQCISYTSV